MSTFTIDPDNNITALVEVPADADRSTTFSTEKELAKLVLRIADFAIVRWRCAFEEVKPIKEVHGLKSAPFNLRRPSPFWITGNTWITGNVAPLTSVTSIRSRARIVSYGVERFSGDGCA
jgi:hypothetical protein